MKLRVLFVSRERIRLPLAGAQRRKWEAIAAVVEPRSLAAAPAGAPAGDATFRLARPLRPRLLDGAVHYLVLPLRVARELRDFAPDAVLVQGVHEGAACLLARRLTGSRARVILDVQGDWRQSTRLYGSRLRRLLDPVTAVLAPLAVRRADAIRTISADTTALVAAWGRSPAAVFPPYVDMEAFLRRPPAPLPPEPAAVFVGSLERVKAFDTLVAAWPEVQRELPRARLHVAGSGRLEPLARGLVARFPETVRWDARLESEQVAAALDASWLLVLPSRAEGLGRVLLEAACRGRALVGADRGGIPDVVRPGENGLLVDPEDARALASALVRVLSDRAEAERLGEAARRDGEAWSVTPEQYAGLIATLVRETLAQ
ncbi:MAG TPA: glycosyltransferase family 4 protein [Gaiellaceae bacterium]|nr:glycosyltransferase family 4 protein [Gaiellaceae bacterium]